MTDKTTVVLGASPNPGRFSHKAVRLLKRKGFDVIPVGRRKGEIEGIPLQPYEVKIEKPVHTVSIYLSPEIQKQFYDLILSFRPRRVIFNPGTENEELEQMLQDRGAEIVRHCTLKMLHKNIF